MVLVKYLNSFNKCLYQMVSMDKLILKLAKSLLILILIKTLNLKSLYLQGLVDKNKLMIIIEYLQLSLNKQGLAKEVHCLNLNQNLNSNNRKLLQDKVKII